MQVANFQFKNSKSPKIRSTFVVPYNFKYTDTSTLFNIVS